MEDAYLDALLYRLLILGCPKVIPPDVCLKRVLKQKQLYRVYIYVCSICKHASVYVCMFLDDGNEEIQTALAEIMASIVLLVLWTTTLDLKEEIGV